MWGNNNVGIHTFVCGETSYLKLTLELKETNFITSKMWGNKGVWLHTLYMVKIKQKHYIKTQGVAKCWAIMMLGHMLLCVMKN
jgi:hypothetical protein